MPFSRNFQNPWPDFSGKSLLITGGTGSFGQSFVKTLLEKFDLRRLIIFSRDELKQYEMEQRFSIQKHPCLRYFLGDVRDRNRLEMAMHKVDVVIHAAALKHVPAAEYNPFECVHTNILGAENVVQAAIRCGVSRVLALSTDKATNPINLYGASKLAADKIFCAANYLGTGTGTRFAVVRYGNVVGSRGSVVPFFQRLIREGADHLPITDPRMTRFWITLDQGVNFVLSSLSAMRGGEIFVPKMPSMRIVDLASAMSGLPQRIIGIRPGEKLHETIISEDEARTTVEFDDRYIVEPNLDWWPHVSHTQDGARRVAEEFHYASNSNNEWLDSDSLRSVIFTESSN